MCLHQGFFMDELIELPYRTFMLRLTLEMRDRLAGVLGYAEVIEMFLSKFDQPTTIASCTQEIKQIASPLLEIISPTRNELDDWQMDQKIQWLDEFIHALEPGIDGMGIIAERIEHSLLLVCPSAVSAYEGQELTEAQNILLCSRYMQTSCKRFRLLIDVAQQYHDNLQNLN